jgi:enterochelin esterase-like enzyme
MESKIIKELIINLQDQSKKEFVLNEFWEAVEKQYGHFTEDLSNDSSCTLLTMVFKGDSSVKTVSLFGELFGQDTEENLLVRIDETDIFYKSYVVANNTRTLYVYVVNEDPEAEWENVDVRIDPLAKTNIVCTDDELFPKEFAVLFKEESLLELPAFILPEEVKDTKQQFNIQAKTLTHPLVTGDRRMWYHEPENSITDKLVVFLDGYEYLYETKALAIIDELVKREQIPAVKTLFIDNRQDRMTNLIFDKDFMTAVNEEISRIEYKEVILVGFSLGGLMASFMCLENPTLYSKILSQSSAFYWEPGNEEGKKNQLVKRFKHEQKEMAKFYVSIGKLEAKIEEHYGANLQMIDVLKANGNKVCFEEHVGGHTYFDAALTLASGLKFLLNE